MFKAGCWCGCLSSWRVSGGCVGCFSARFWGVRHVFSCGVCFWCIPVGGGLSLLPCQCVMHLNVNSSFEEL